MNSRMFTVSYMILIDQIRLKVLIDIRPFAEKTIAQVDMNLHGVDHSCSDMSKIDKSDCQLSKTFR